MFSGTAGSLCLSRFHSLIESHHHLDHQERLYTCGFLSKLELDGSIYICDDKASFEHIFQSYRAARSYTWVYLCRQIKIFIGCSCRSPLSSLLFHHGIVKFVVRIHFFLLLVVSSSSSSSIVLVNIDESVEQTLISFFFYWSIKNE